MRSITRFPYTIPYTLAQRPYIVGVMVTQTEETFSTVSVARGHHVYKSVRTPLLGERLSVRSETGNNHDKYAVSFVKHGGIVGNLPRELLRTVWHFILHGGHVSCEVTGKRKLGNGLEMARIHRKMFFVFRDNFLLVWNKLFPLSK